MHRTQIYLEDSQYRALQARARREGKSMAALIREIIDEHMGASGAAAAVDPLKGLIGIGQGDGSAVAENYEDYLYGEQS